MKSCPCCGYLTIDDRCEIITDICEICFWQYDEFCQENPDRIIGPNRVSLNVARQNYKLFGAVEKRFLKLVRPPQEET